MPRDVNEIPITPAVLRWARETRGYSPQQAARILGIATPELLTVERTAKSIPAGLFMKMLSAYKQVESVLLLPDVPDHDPLPQDFRTAQGKSAELTLETRMVIREARRFQHAISELALDEPELIPLSNIPRATLAGSPDGFAASERARFAVSLSTQRRWRATASDDEAFRKWRTRAQELGIFVLLKQMPWNDCRGLSLWDNDLLPVIVVNAKDTTTARVFTLFHEYAHLVLRESAACLLSAKTYGSKARIERWCNSFAAAFLMPASPMRERIAEAYFYLRPQDWGLKEVEKLAREFKVSRVAMAIRLKELDVTNFYETNRDDLFGYDKKAERRKEGAGKAKIMPNVVRLSEIGSATAGIILDALHENVIDTFEASDILDLSPDQIDRLATRTKQQRSRDAPR